MLSLPNGFLKHAHRFYLAPPYRSIIAELDNYALGESDTFSTERITEIQKGRLTALLDHARKRTPYWRQYSSYRFESLPIVSKLEIKQNPESFMSERTGSFFCLEDFTSGSSGIPLRFFTDRRFVPRRTALYKRGDRWAGVMRRDQILRVLRKDIPGQEGVGFFYRFVDHQQLAKDRFALYRLLSSGRLAIYGFASFLIAFSKLVEADKVAFRLRTIISMGERLPDFYRLLCERLFSCKVFDCYSMREFGRIAQECSERNGLHINAESILIEIVDVHGRILPPGKTGRIILTFFDNFVMPFIRYDTGDEGSITWSRCACGRSLPMLFLKGRSNEFIRLKSERTIHLSELYRVFNPRWKKIRQFQIHQKAITNIILRIVPEGRFDGREKEALLREAKAILGDDVNVGIELVETLPLTTSGKTELFINDIARVS